MPMEWFAVKADNIDGAAEWIIDFLEHTDKAGNVIYFHGWGGWGASAVLKEVAKRLTSSSGWAETGTARGLGKIINIDFLRWQSKRSLQKQIAEELKLPNQVMALFDQLDEKDDLDGVKQSSRGVIPYVRLAIMNELSTRRFLVILYNGSGSYIDLWEVGVPVIGDLGKRVLWTSRGRFWHHLTEGHGIKKDVEELAGLSDIAISAGVSGYDENDATTLDTIRHLVYAEAAEVAKCMGVPEPDMSQKIVMECILYRALIGNNHNISWECHASNCWVCDGIIQDAADGSKSAWEIGDALQMNVNLDLLNCCVEGICKLLEQWKRMDRWVSVTSQTTTEVQVPSQATSFFWTGGGLEACMFEHSNKTSLRVLHLSHCTFSFSSPPFLRCSHLRFLLLDHCKNKDAQDDGEENNFHHHSHHSQENGGAWFQNLWVLELSYTDWYWLLSKDMLDLMSDLRELNVKGVGNQSMSHLHRCSGPRSNSRKLLKLRVVAESYKDNGHDGAGGDRIQQESPMVASFPDLSSWHILKTIVLDGCGDLEIIGSDALPLSLESFSLTSNVVTRPPRVAKTYAASSSQRRLRPTT
ncbi:uncharacterized protein [Miscanthus floridulus]|uniref:uncharacterized protein n=1 Tax=Miscanthus floridulus TaxID=154761 RepID=UPI0034590E2C